MAAVPDDRDPYYNTHSTAQQGALRSFRLVQFDPAKPDTFKGWEAALLAGLSDSTAAAVRLGSCPTYGEAAKSLGLNATKAQIGELHCTLTDLWNQAQAEAYRVITLSIDFKSPKGKMLLERSMRDYAKERKGIDLLHFMRRKYSSNLSFSKQQLLIDKLQPGVLASEIAEINNPDEADDYLHALYGDIWLEIKGNEATRPLDFVRRVLTAMSTVDGRVSQLAYTHTCALDAALHTREEAEWSMNAIDVPLLNKVYHDAESFISAITMSWPTVSPQAFTLKRTREPRAKLVAETNCKSCNCRGCDGKPCYALNPDRKIDDKMSQAQIKFINIARAYVAKHGAAGLKTVAFSVWKRGGDAPSGGGNGTAKATQREECTDGDDALDSHLGGGAIDPDTLAELLEAAGYEIEAEISEEASPMLHATHSQPDDDSVSRVLDMLEKGDDDQLATELATEQLIRMAGAAAEVETQAEPAPPPPSSPTPVPPTPPPHVAAAATRGSLLSPKSLSEFARRLDGPTAIDTAPPTTVATAAAAGEKYRLVIRALVESRAAALRNGQGGVAALTGAALRAGVCRATAWRLIKGVALLRLADSMGASDLLRRAAAKAWLIARSLGGKAAEALLDKLLSVVHATAALAYSHTMRPRSGAASPARGGIAHATRGVRAGAVPRTDEMRKVLTDNCATENITNNLPWLLPDSIAPSTVGRYQGCEQGGGVVATKEGIAPLLVAYYTKDDATLRTGLLLRRWQYSANLDSSLFSEAYERNQMQSLFMESRGADGKVRRSINLANGWIVPLTVNPTTGISRLTLLCDPSRMVETLGGATPRGQLSAHVKLEAPPLTLMTAIGHVGGVAHSTVKEFDCVRDAENHPLDGSIIMMASNVGMSKVKLKPCEWMAIEHQKLAHAPVHRIIMTANSKMLSGMGRIVDLSVADVRGFMLTGCDTCNASKLKRPPVSSRPSGMPAPQTVGARGDAYRNRKENKTRVEFDTFGPVDPPSVEGYIYVRQFYLKELVRDGQSYLRAGRVLYGSKSKSEADALLCLNRFLAELGLTASECDVLRVDDAKETKGREFTAHLATALIHGEINPGYMHHMLGGCEAGWHAGTTGAIANLKNYGDDKRHWYSAMLHAFMAEDVLAVKDADGNFTSAHFRRTGRTADGSTLAPYGCPVRYLIDKSLRTKFDEHSAPGRYRGTSTTHLSSVLLSSKNGAMINVHAGMVVPDLSKAIMPQSEAMREYAASAAANAVGIAPAGQTTTAGPPVVTTLPAPDASRRARRDPQIYGSYTGGSFAPGQATLMLALSRGGVAPPSIMKLQVGDSVPAAELESIRSGIGGLSYVSYFRFDAAQPFSRLGRVQANPPPEAGVILDHVIKALLETADDTWTVGAPGVTEFTPMPDVPPFSRDAKDGYVKNFGGHVISDANLENPVCSSAESSTSGARSMLCSAVMLGGAAVAFSAGRAAAMAADTTVAELFALVNGMIQGIVCRGLLCNLGYGYACETAWSAWSDCEGAISVCTNVSAPKRSLWVGRRARLGQELVENGDFQPKHCEGLLNPCDSGTKRTPTKQSTRDFGYLMGSDTAEWDQPPATRLFAAAAANGEDATNALLAATLHENAEFESLAGVETLAVTDAASADDTSAIADAEVARVLNAAKGVIGANSSAEAVHEVLHGQADADGFTLEPDDADGFTLEPDDAEAAEVLACRLNSPLATDCPDPAKLLACYTHDDDNLFLAMQADGSVSLLTKDGIIEINEPTGYRQAMKSPEREKWLQSMGVEVQNFKDSNTYTLVPLDEVPKGKPIFQLSWKYKLKRKGDGTLDKYKSRCVMMGNRMVKGRDYSESFAIGARMLSIRTIFAICAVHGLIDFTVDIRGAYLNAKKPSDGIGSRTYVWQPPGFEETGPNGERLVGLLNTYVYGDPEGGRAWAAEFDGHLTGAVGAKMCDMDPNVGRVDHKLGYVIFAKYVDELIAAGSTPEVVAWFTEAVSSKYSGCTSGPWDTLLGFGVVHDRANRTVKVSARKLIHDLARRRGFTI